MNESFKMLLSFVLIGIALIAIAYFNPILYKGPWAVWRLIEITILLIFSTHIKLLEYHNFLGEAFNTLFYGRWASIELDFMHVVDSLLVHEYTGIIYVLIAVFVVYKRNGREKHNKSLNFDELLEQLSRHFRFARCMIALDPTKDVKQLDMKTTAFRLKEEVIPFLERHGAIGEFRRTPASELVRYLKKDKAHEVCVTTLGRPFTTIEDLNYYERWLFAVFCLQMKSKKYGADKEYLDAELILGDISYHINGECNLKRVTKLTNAAIEKFRDDPQVVKIIQSHNYISGVLKELFHQAKGRGVHPTIHFPWLYTVDRTLMLVLDETGMPDERGEPGEGGVPEVSSPESGIESYYPRLHWTNEKKTGVKLMTPELEYIIDYIEGYLIKVYDFVSEREALTYTSSAPLVAQQQDG